MPHDSDPPFPPLAIHRDPPTWGLAASLRASLLDLRERAVVGALDRALGPGCWTPETLRERGHWTVQGLSETLHLDGRPLLRMGPLPEPRIDWNSAEVGAVRIGYVITPYEWKPEP